MSEFFAMGGYGSYIWISYAVFVLVLLADALMPLLRRRQLLNQLSSQIQRQHARRSTP